MKNWWLLSLALIGLGCQQRPGPVEPTSTTPTTPVISNQISPIAFLDLPQALNESRKTGKPVAVFLVLGDWQRHCWLAGHVMRAETLGRAEVVSRLEQHFILAWTNLMPELYGTSPSSQAPVYPQAQTEGLPEGAGGGNIRVYFCRPNGQIVHQVRGLMRPPRFLGEVDHAAKMVALGERDLLEQQHQHFAQTLKEFEERQKNLPQGSGWKDPKKRDLASCGVRLVGLEELNGDLLKPVIAVIDRRREEVYTKGALGCNWKDRSD